MLSDHIIQTVFTHFKFGDASRYESRSDDVFEDYRVVTTTGIYALMPIKKPFRIGGGLHLNLYESHAASFIGPCALYVTCKVRRQMTLPKIPIDGRYWVIFKAVSVSPDSSNKNTFVSYRGGQKFRSTVTFDENGSVAKIHKTEIKPTDRKYWVFWDPNIEPELHQVDEK